jgi:hypothetical protein
MFCDGRKAITTPNSATRLVSPGNQPENRITNISLQVPPDSEGVYVGGSGVVSTAGSETGIYIGPGGSDSFSATDAADVFIAGPANAVVRWRAKAL